MTRSIVLIALLAGCDPLTEVLVRIDNADLTVPSEVRRVVMSVTNPLEPAAGERYHSQDLQICDQARLPGCVDFPLSVTLIPGTTKPGALVRVQIDAFGDGATLSQAAIFTFSPGYSQHLDFALHRSCLGRTCAARDQACDAAGDCINLTPVPPSATGPAIVRVEEVGNYTIASTADVGLPSAQPGDLVLVAILIATQGLPPEAPAVGGWNTLGELRVVNDVGRLFYRFVDEADDASIYQFRGNDAAGTFQFAWVRAVYRNVRGVEAKAISNLTQTPAVFPRVTTEKPGSLIVGFLEPAEGGPCTGPSELADFHDYYPVPWIRYDEPRPLPGSSDPHAISCSDPRAGLYQILLSP